MRNKSARPREGFTNTSFDLPDGVKEKLDFASKVFRNTQRDIVVEALQAWFHMKAPDMSTALRVMAEELDPRSKKAKAGTS